ncbi:Predicted nuclease (RNAse H fold) [Marinospirillum celere]|uniref:Predicted nuclease (RNAse H fold) n=1 Tax=Marinospirillum celere TaxID=1122252 RepID=A0A1I1ENP4_9GAMM|nr:DUF429 domain-containing protein [Marinospirillum celere]SFB88272.1 Predicted nuclease (RNAse H fold) [Marinospirillum celere]
MKTLLVGFDSAWTPSNSGALVGILSSDDGTYQELGLPQAVNYSDATDTITQWQSQYKPQATLVMLDQPTIVKNPSGQRPVENLVASPVSRRYGGVQPANTGKAEMFGQDAPIWAFLNKFGGPANPLIVLEGTWVIETYPVLAMIALGWTLPDSVRSTGKLPKYNPERRKTFSISDWQHVCNLLSKEIGTRNLPKITAWLEQAAQNKPRKNDQDCLDACICLLVAFNLIEARRCLMIGDMDSGYIVAPYGKSLSKELEARAIKTKRVPAEWVKPFYLSVPKKLS